MGKHATIGRSMVGHKSTTLKQGSKLAAISRVANAALLAGPVKFGKGSPITSDRSLDLMALILTRKVTRINATVSDFRKVKAGQFELRLRDLGILVIVRNVKTETFTGWQAIAQSMGTLETTVLSVVEKGSAANVNGERVECCGAALNLLNLMVSGNKRGGATAAVNARGAWKDAPKVEKLTVAGEREIARCPFTTEPINVCYCCH